MNIRLDKIHHELLEKMVERFEAEGIKTNKTDVIQRALFSFARDHLDSKSIDETIDRHYKGFLK